TPVGAARRGNLISAGLQTEDWAEVLVGCVAAAALALLADGALALVERGLALRARWSLRLGAAAVLFGLLLAALPLVGGGGQRPGVVGAKNFSEQFILARLIGARLERAGYSGSYWGGVGSAGGAGPQW